MQMRLLLFSIAKWRHETEKMLCHCSIPYVQDILRDYLDKRERGELVCQKKTAISEILNQKVSYVIMLKVVFSCLNLISVLLSVHLTVCLSHLCTVSCQSG